MTSKVYDAFKFFALVVLPGTGALYFAVSELWGLPYAAQVVGTIAAVDTFLGLILKRSSSNYDDKSANAPVLGDLKLFTDYDGIPTGRFSLPGDLFDGVVFEDGKFVSLRVKKAVEQR